MKKTFLVLIIMLTFLFQSNAQIDVTTNPIGILFNSYTLAVDYHTSPDWSFGGDVRIKTAGLLTGSRSSFYANAKHYFNPLSDAKMFYVGMFLGGRSIESNIFLGIENRTINTYGGGFMLGYKLVSRKSFIVDVGGGLGRGFSNKVSNAVGTYEISLFYFRANVGYRFGAVTEKETVTETF